MGFFSSLTGAQKTKTPATGFYSLPKNAQGAFNQLVNDATQLSQNTSLFKPADFTQAQTSAFDLAAQAANPTAQSVSNVVSPYLNPYIGSVIDEVNRQAQGENSILQQNISAAGQLGSNRQFLGANDIDLSRMEKIGSIMSGQYNTALGTGLNQQQQAIQNLLQTGGMQQAQNQQIQQAPLTANDWLSGVMSAYPTGAFLNSAPAGSVKTSGGIGGLLNTAGTIASIRAASDQRLKENIEYVGAQNGHNIYEFSYKDMPSKRYRGVMAQEVLETHPEAIYEKDGFLSVDYGKIGVNFDEVRHGVI